MVYRLLNLFGNRKPPLFLLSTLLLVSCQAPIYDLKVQFGVNTEKKDPTSVTRFDTKDIALKTFPEDQTLHFILNFYVEVMDLTTPLNVTLSLPHDDNLLVFFQFGVHPPLMRIEGQRKLFEFAFAANENQAYVFSLLPKAPMVIHPLLISTHRFLDLNQGQLPTLTISEVLPS